MFRSSAFLTRLCPRRLTGRHQGPSKAVRWMSVHPEEPEETTLKVARNKVTIQHLHHLRAQNIPITMLTAYDYPSARRTEHGDIDICLVGDSLAQVALGYDSTTRLTLDEMLYHCRAVARGAKNPLLVADMPFGTYQLGPRDALDAAVRMVREGMMEGVKLEGGEEILDTVRVLTGLGIPVMGHIGLLPQRHASLSGYKVQGKNVEDALSIARAAKALEQAGAFSIVLEAIPSPLAAHITSSLHIPTIGIGAGAQCSGQVLVQDDALSVWSAGHKAKFVRRFAQVGQEAQRGVDGYARAVRSGDFPADEEGYGMSESVFDKFKDALGKEGESSMMATS